VVYCTLQEPTPKAAIAVVWKRHEVSPTVQRFLETVRQVVHEEI
ncbi:MAG: LysR family transcriptional regulator, partial [Microcoleus sp. SIO2G3]|nr:LysR family transcriptional regulator [Microcoleus sp. SIO2G3]